MIELSQQLERYYSRNGVYSSSSATVGNDSSTPYTLSFVTSADGDEFTISATPTGGQTSDDCSTLTLNYIGNKTPATSGCWK